MKLKNKLTHHIKAEDFKVVDGYCNFCGDQQTKCFISSTIQKPQGEGYFVDLRLDLDNNQIDADFGPLDKNGVAQGDSDWTNTLNIHYCPVCGRKLPVVK